MSNCFFVFNMSTKTFLLTFSIIFAVLFSAYLWEPIASISTDELNKPLVAVIVDSEIYNGIKFSLDQYSADVEKSGFSARIIQLNELSNTTKEAVREYLQGLLSQNLVGVLLVGDIPEAWYEVKSNKFPTDAYYMDLNGTWVDTNGNGIYDNHDEMFSPEIWVGRLKVSTVNGNEVILLNNYFEKNHRYRNQLISLPWWRVLLYMDDLGVMQGHDAVTPLSYIAPEITAVTNTQTTNATDFKQRLQDEVGYHWLYLMSHGTATNHTFQIPSKETFLEWDGTVYSSDYRMLNPHIFFYHFFVCAAGRYTEPNYLGGSAVFGNEYGLLAIASTDNTYTFPFNSFYKAVSKRNSIGTAFLQWLKNSTTAYAKQTLPLNNKDDYEILFHDAVIIGDPTLQLYVENHDIALTDLTVFSKNVSGLETLIITFTVENMGDYTETFNVTVFFDFSVMYYTELTLASKKNQTITFSPKDSFNYIWGNFSRHAVQAKTSVLTKEFNISNNFQRAYFYSKVMRKSLPQQLPLVFFVIPGIGIFGIVAITFLKLLMSERPLYQFRKGIAKIHANIKKRWSS